MPILIMKKILILIPFITFGQTTTTPKWVIDLENSTELNKAQHYWVSSIGVVVIGTSINHYIEKPAVSSLIAGVVMFGIGELKESVWDGIMNRGVKSGGDRFMNGVGCVAGMMKCRVVIDIRESGLKKRKDKYEY